VDADSASPPARTRTWRRRLLELLPHLGLEVTDLFPGAVVVTRRPLRLPRPGRARRSAPARGKGLEARGLAPGSALVRRRALARKHRLEVERALYAYLLPEHLVGLLAHYRVNCVLDVGANRGQYARMLRRAGYRGQIVSFEPVPDLHAALVKASAADERWSVHQMALGRTDGSMHMNVVPGTMSSLLSPSEYGTRRYSQLRDVHEVEVPVRRLDGLLDTLPELQGRRLFLKMDTQGFDLEAFAGLGDRVEQVVGLQSEVALLTIYDDMPRLPEALPVYEAAGFGVTGFYPVTREWRTWRVLEFDCVMARADAL
jgi:FkbM family methyltransferase